MGARECYELGRGPGKEAGDDDSGDRRTQESLEQLWDDGQCLQAHNWYVHVVEDGGHGLHLLELMKVEGFPHTQMCEAALQQCCVQPEKIPGASDFLGLRQSHLGTPVRVQDGVGTHPGQGGQIPFTSVSSVARTASSCPPTVLPCPSCEIALAGYPQPQLPHGQGHQVHLLGSLACSRCSRIGPS